MIETETKGKPKSDKATWPYIKLSPELLERLSQEAQRRGLIPTRVKRGQDPIKLGIIDLIETMAGESERGEHAK